MFSVEQIELAQSVHESTKWDDLECMRDDIRKLCEIILDSEEGKAYLRVDAIQMHKQQEETRAFASWLDKMIHQPAKEKYQ